MHIFLNNNSVVLQWLVLLVVAVGLSQPSAGQEFRMESSVYNDDSNLQIAQNVTLFSQGVVYDFQLSDDAKPVATEIAILDTRNRMMILLDPSRQVKLELSGLRLLKIVEAVRRETMQDKRTSFLVNDSFTEDIDWSTNWVTMTSPQIEYRFQGSQPKDVSVIPAYLDFLDMFTQLNASDPTKIPPFARMKLNEKIRTLGWIPSEVQITTKQNSLFRQPISARSKHVIMHRLSDQDSERIQQAKQNWMHFKGVDLAEYRGLRENKRFEIPVTETASYETPVELENSSTDKSSTNGSTAGDLPANSSNKQLDGLTVGSSPTAKPFVPSMLKPEIEIEGKADDKAKKFEPRSLQPIK